jgi:hypothetical protein
VSTNLAEAPQYDARHLATPPLEDVERLRDQAARAALGALVTPAIERPQIVGWNRTRELAAEYRTLTLEERNRLTEVYAFTRFMRPDGTVPQDILSDQEGQYISHVKEAAIPRAVHTSYQRYENGKYWWRRQTDEEMANNGYAYYEPAIHPRIDQDKAEATHLRHSLRAGRYLGFLSLKATEMDMPEEVAERANLHRDDLLRIHWLDTDEQGAIRGKFMQSALVRDVPIEAWVAMLRDPANIFGKAIHVEDERSALAVIKTFRELDLPQDRLPDGVVSLAEAVLPYVPAESQASVSAQIELLKCDQTELHQKAANVAVRWMAFDAELARSVLQGQATPEVQTFVDGLSDAWNDEDLALFAAHQLPGRGLSMSFKLAARIEEAKQNLILVPAAVVGGNQEVIDELGSEAAATIYMKEMRIQELQLRGASLREISAVEQSKDRQVAAANVSVGGGCPGDVNGNFRTNKKDAVKKSGEPDKKDESDRSKAFKKKAKDREKNGRKREWMRCVHCPLCDKDGVDAYIDYFPARNKKRITCCSCHGNKEYEHKS